jgi:hypothetical protein
MTQHEPTAWLDRLCRILAAEELEAGAELFWPEIAACQNVAAGELERLRRAVRASRHRAEGRFGDG